jgi:hypothetical protein
MPDFSPDYTYRYKVRYLAGGITHDFVVRGDQWVTDGETHATALAANVGEFFANLEDQLFDDFAFQSASWAYRGSSVFVPTTNVPTDPTGVFNPALVSSRHRATACTMSGRGLAEGHAKLYFFGAHFPDHLVDSVGADGVITAAEFGGIVNAAAVATTRFHSSDGAAAIFYERLTVKVNDRLLRIVRRLGV